MPSTPTDSLDVLPAGTEGVSSAIRARSLMIWVGVAALVAGGAAFFVQRAGDPGGSPPEPDAELLMSIDDMEERGDCNALQDEFDLASDALGPPGSEEHSRTSSLIRYVEGAMMRSGCEVFIPLEVERDGPLAGSTRSAYY